MGISGTCSDSGETSSGSFSPGVMTESQKESADMFISLDKRHDP